MFLKGKILWVAERTGKARGSLLQAPAPSGPINVDVITDIAMQQRKAEVIEPARHERIFPHPRPKMPEQGEANDCCDALNGDALNKTTRSTSSGTTRSVYIIFQGKLSAVWNIIVVMHANNSVFLLERYFLL